MPHVIGMPDQVFAAVQEFTAKLGVASTVADVPLTTRHDFKGAIAFFEELNGMHDGTRFAEHCSGFAQHFHNLGLGLIDE